MTFVDKTLSNVYRLIKEQHVQLIINSMISTYRKANSNIKKQINKARKKFNERQKKDKTNENKRKGQQLHYNKTSHKKFRKPSYSPTNQLC